MVVTIAVIGAGQMGSGIAQVFAQSGFKVTLQDVSQAQLDKALKGIHGSLGKLAEKGKITAEVASAAKESITTTTNLRDCAGTSVAIEAVVENFETKKEVFQTLDGVLAPDAVLASNTSSISIARLGASTRRPSQVIGMHFMNPVPIMPCIEVIRADATSEQTFQTVKELVAKLGKTMVVSKDRPGFIVNRILMPMINEAAYALQEGLASREDIDTAMKLSCNFPMGPLTLADFIGLDTVVSILEVMHEGIDSHGQACGNLPSEHSEREGGAQQALPVGGATRAPVKDDAKFRSCPLLKEYVAKGWRGRKSGRGFYTYGS